MWALSGKNTKSILLKRNHAALSRVQLLGNACLLINLNTVLVKDVSLSYIFYDSKKGNSESESDNSYRDGICFWIVCSLKHKE